MTPMLMSVAEPAFTPYPVYTDEEAHAIVLGLLVIFRKMLDATPIWEQCEFSRRAENVLRRNHLVTWSDLSRAMTRGCIPGGGTQALTEFRQALFGRAWSME